jgi:2-polyprenyl-6-hydroxyphenyl methylase/3-demethylubiquinone-9 3-methyltransferase
VIGIDIDADELAAAPPGSYDETIAADICRTAPTLDADLVICSAVLEHIRDAPAALENIVRLARPGGRVVAFLPCRNAPFAILNRIIPEGIKRRILFRLFPRHEDRSGFPAFYDMATPRLYRKWAEEHGVEVEELRTYHSSGYFHFFFPLFLVWRLYSLLAFRFFPMRGAETFSIVLRRPPEPARAMTS